jgi:type 1 glutamine amidotransferase
MFSRTAGFRHDSIANARALLTTLPASEGIAVTATEDPSVFSDEALAEFDVVAFVNTTGDVLDEEQQAAMERFIRAGNGYVGVHSAADCEYQWPWYGRLVGAYFRNHPLLPVDVEVTTEHADHPSTDDLPTTFQSVDEIYNFGRSPRKDHTILLTVDEAGFIYPNTDGGPSMGADHPIAWYLYLSEPVPDPAPASGPPGENVLARFVLGDDDQLDLDSRLDLLRVPSERQQSHEGGGLAVGPDGTLYVSTGDNTDPFASDGFAPLDERPGRERFNSQRTAANPFDLRGKILRINRDGSIPDGNLFAADGAQGRPEIFVMGCRNPFRIAVDPLTGRLAWGDVGPDPLSDGVRGPRGYDEINVADQPGNYGWPRCIADRQPYADFDFASGTVGADFDCSATQPASVFYDYLTTSYVPLGNALDPEGRPTIPGVAITGRLAIAGTFSRVPPQAPFALPAPFRDALLMADWSRGVIAALDIAADGTLRSMTRVLPWEPFVPPIDLEIGPDVRAVRARVRQRLLWRQQRRAPQPRRVLGQRHADTGRRRGGLGDLRHRAAGGGLLRRGIACAGRRRRDRRLRMGLRQRRRDRQHRCRARPYLSSSPSCATSTAAAPTRCRSSAAPASASTSSRAATRRRPRRCWSNWSRCSPRPARR